MVSNIVLTYLWNQKKEANVPLKFISLYKFCDHRHILKWITSTIPPLLLRGYPSSHPRRHLRSWEENATRSTIRFAIFLEVTGRSHAAASQNSTPCQEEQDRFYDLLLAAVAALSMGPARVALGDRNCPGVAFVWGWHVIGRRTGAPRWNQSKRNHLHFQVSEMFPFTQPILCYVCIFCMPWLNMIKLL